MARRKAWGHAALLSYWAWNPCQKDEATRLPEFDKGRSTYLDILKKKAQLMGLHSEGRTRASLLLPGKGGHGLHFVYILADTA